MDWYLGVWKKYATFTGRARRTEYWMFILFNFLVTFVLSFIDGLLGLAGDNGYGPLYGIYALAVFIPTLAVGVRRMHDTDHSGWWLLLPIVNLIFSLLPGTVGPNRFGADPKNPEFGVAGHAPATGGSAYAPAGWLPDPTGRHQYRYWDGARWTENVSDNGATAVDPI